MKIIQRALLNRVPFGKFNRASAFPIPLIESRFSGAAGSFKISLFNEDIEVGITPDAGLSQLGLSTVRESVKLLICMKICVLTK